MKALNMMDHLQLTYKLNHIQLVVREEGGTAYMQ